MNSLTAQILVNIIKQEMDLPDDSVWLRDQNRLIPNDNRLYIVVGMVSARPVSNNVYMEQQTVGPATEQHQICQVQQEEMIQIDILSRSNAALTRNWEVIAAMQSFYGQQQQELNYFKIFRIPQAFVNSSIAEGGSYLNKYSITFPVMVWYRKDTVMNSPLGDYYDKFGTRVDDEQTIGQPEGLIEFEIIDED